MTVDRRDRGGPADRPGRPGHLRLVGRRRPGETYPVDTATAELVRDTSRRDAWTLFLDGVESSHVDLDDPTYLDFEYMRWLGDVVDCLAPAGEPLSIAHLGGGAATLARYVAATRPRSRQLVFEIDAALIALVRERLPLPRGRLLRVKAGDARQGLQALPPGSVDVVVRDVFFCGAAPDAVRTVEFARLVREALTPTGTYLVNVADGVPLRGLGTDLAGLLGVFDQLAVVSEPGVFRGRRHGNLIIAASCAPLPIDEISRRVGLAAVPGRLRSGARVRTMAQGCPALHDADPRSEIGLPGPASPPPR